MNNSRLRKLFDKEVISLDDLRDITNDESVSEVREAKPDNRYEGLSKYEIRMINGDIYYAYIKKPWYERFLKKKDE